MTGTDLAPRRWDPAWQRSRAGMPDGDVTLWLAALGEDDELLGAGPVTRPEGWRWAHGGLTYGYGEVRMGILREGRTARGMIVAVSPAAGRYAPLLPFTMSGEDVRPGMTLTVLGGEITLITPEGR